MKPENFFKTPERTWYFILGYLLLNGIARLLILPTTLWIDEAEQIYMSQWLTPAAFEVQPPLYSWVHYFAFELFGPSILFIEAFKIFVITVTYRGVFKIISLASNNHPPAVILCMASLPFILQLWDETFTRTNTIVVTCASVWVVYMVMIITEKGTWKHYLLLGFFLGIGFLSKYSFVLAMAAMFVAGITITKTRQVMLSPLFLITVFSFLLVISPHAFWFLENLKPTTSNLETELGGPETESYFTSTFRGLKSFGSAAFAFIGTWFIVMILFFQKEIARWKTCQPNLWITFFFRYLVVVTLLMLVSLFVFGVTTFHERYFQPFYIFIPVYFFLKIKELLLLQGKKSIWLQRLSLVFFILIFYFNNLLLVINPLLGKTDVMQIPYNGIAAELKKEIRSADLIVVNSIRFAGNLKLNLGQQKIVLWNDSVSYKKEIQNPVYKTILYAWMADEERIPYMITSNKIIPAVLDTGAIIFRDVYYRAPAGKKITVGFVRIDK